MSDHVIAEFGLISWRTGELLTADESRKLDRFVSAWEAKYDPARLRDLFDRLRIHVNTVGVAAHSSYSAENITSVFHAGVVELYNETEAPVIIAGELELASTNFPEAVFNVARTIYLNQTDHVEGLGAVAADTNTYSISQQLYSGAHSFGGHGVEINYDNSDLFLTNYEIGDQFYEAVPAAELGLPANGSIFLQVSLSVETPADGKEILKLDTAGYEVTISQKDSTDKQFTVTLSVGGVEADSVDIGDLFSFGENKLTNIYIKYRHNSITVYYLDAAGDHHSETMTCSPDVSTNAPSLTVFKEIVRPGDVGDYAMPVKVGVYATRLDSSEYLYYLGRTG